MKYYRMVGHTPGYNRLDFCVTLTRGQKVKLDFCENNFVQNCLRDSRQNYNVAYSIFQYFLKYDYDRKTTDSFRDRPVEVKGRMGQFTMK